MLPTVPFPFQRAFFAENPDLPGRHPVTRRLSGNACKLQCQLFRGVERLANQPQRVPCGRSQYHKWRCSEARSPGIHPLKTWWLDSRNPSEQRKRGHGRRQCSGYNHFQFERNDSARGAFSRSDPSAGIDFDFSIETFAHATTPSAVFAVLLGSFTCYPIDLIGIK